jgi:iron complex outermembrane recepter protein
VRLTRFKSTLLETALLAPCCMLVATTAHGADRSSPSAFDLSIEQLGQIQVTTASRRPEGLDVTPAAVYVITAEDIRRSGVTTIQDALRLAPNVEVARNNSHQWTISIRGFSSDLSNKLLVLIDGRSVYSPLYAGVFWDVQDVLLADVERIEVVAGPGGAVWGANAVNGVINIITQSAQDRQGLYAEAGAGNEEQAFGALRYGWKGGEKLWLSAFVKSFDRDSTKIAATGADGDDDWHLSHGGFALTWQPDTDDRVNVRADLYAGDESTLTRSDFTLGTLPATGIPANVPVSGNSVTANWRHALDAGASWRLQFYFDHTDRQIPGSFNEARSTYNVAFLHDLSSKSRHDLQWGIEYRSTADDIGNTQFSSFIPPSRTDQTLSAFAQDRIELKKDRTYLTLGTKLEHNDYTGYEHEPSVRFTWQPGGGRQTLWAAASDAVRIPARLNTDVHLYAPVSVPGLPPIYINVNGNPNFLSETLRAYEVGYRVPINDKLSLDVTAFDNYYDHLMTNEPAGPLFAVPGPPPYLIIPAVEGNGMKGENHGGSFALNWQPLSRWRLQFHGSFLTMDLESKPGSADVNSLKIAGNSPRSMLSVLSFLELGRGFMLYTGLRHVDKLPSLQVPAYDALDVSFAWRPNDRLRLSLTAQSLNDAEHIEFGGGNLIERSVLARFEWRL